jgi:hypothetical protein
MGSEMNWWDTSDFLAFLPFIEGKPANDKRRKKHMRLELHAPVDVAQKALAFEVLCVRDNKPMHPFRQRSTGGIYLAVSCGQLVSLRCSRSKGARAAYDAIEAMLQ